MKIYWQEVKKYKTEINKSILQYKHSMRTKVRQMQQKSPKHFCFGIMLIA